MSGPATGRTVAAGLLLGWSVWLLALIVLYGTLSLGCSFGWNERTLYGGTLLRGMLWLLWMVHLAVLAVLCVGWWRRSGGLSSTPGFALRVGRIGMASATVATAALALPLLAPQLCG